MKYLEHKMELATADGTEAEARVVRLTREQVIADLFGPASVLRASEALPNVKIAVGGQVVYNGRAVVQDVVSTEGSERCTLNLESDGLVLEVLPGVGPDWKKSYRDFTAEFQGLRRIHRDFKTAVVDLYHFLTNLKVWLDRAEMSFSTMSKAAAEQSERQLIEQIRPALLQTLAGLTARFEDEASRVEPSERLYHEHYVRTLLHPLVLCAPFAHRTYSKPLGYAGDYEMMNMIHRRAGEGKTLYARVVHHWLGEQPPAEAVRNRVAYLGERILTETLRVHHEGRRARILNVGCGPAREVEEFIQRSKLSDSVDFYLIDFNEETLRYVGDTLTRTIRKENRKTGIHPIEISVYHLLRKSVSDRFNEKDRYDMVYCAGLFDYLSAGVSKQLVSMFVKFVRPGGLILVANMDDSRPFRYNTEYLLDWHLIYRDSRQMTALVPADFAGQSHVSIEPAIVNLFLELRPGI
jgi:extracellular factor (EF) 3-hydroxypalmitic acid methyl ester biosynthesis protein